MKYFYVGVHLLTIARHFERSFISANILRKRKSDFIVNKWILDSGAFTEISKYGYYRSDVKEYAEQIKRWSSIGQLESAVSQDYMCEPFILKKTGLNIIQHQQKTIERYDALLQYDLPIYLMPVLQGWLAHDYIKHLDMYQDRLGNNAYIGVGSICKRNSTPQSVRSILSLIKHYRPDLRIHAFGLKQTALQDPNIRHLIYTGDSMAWSFAARLAGRDANSWKEAKLFEQKIQCLVDKPTTYAKKPIWLI